MPPRLFIAGLSGSEFGLSLLASNVPPYGARASLLSPDDMVYPAPGGGLLRVAVGGGAASQMLGTAAGQITYWDAAAGLWLPTAAAPADGQLAVWRAGTQTYEFVDLPNLGALQYFDASFSPVGRWNFNGTLADAGGVAANDLTLGAGQLAFCDIVAGKLGLYVMANSRYQTAARPPALALAGDMTFAAIVQQDSIPLVQQPLARFSGFTETEDENILWSNAFEPTGSPVDVPRRLSYLAEHGAGINDTYVSGGNASLPPVHNIALVGFTREGDSISPYYNGLPFGPPSAPLPTPTGGTSAACRMVVGSNSLITTVSHPFVLFTMQVIPSALSAADWIDLYNQSMGPAFGRL